MDELGVVAACAASPSRPALAEAALAALIELVDAESASYIEVPLFVSGSIGLTVVHPWLARHNDLLDVWATRHWEHPWVRCASAGSMEAARLSDIATSRQLHALPFYQDFLRPRGGQHGLYFPVGIRGGMLVAFGVVRADRDFSERDVEVMERVRVPLAGIWGQVRAREQLAARVAALELPGRSAGRTDVIRRLTPAEREVALMVTEGLDNASIARARQCSCKAVEHLLTSAYRKVGVSSRTQLVARVAFPGMTGTS